MSERLDYLKNRFAQGLVYLVYTGSLPKLANEREMLDMADGPVFYVHLPRQLELFEAQVGGEGAYSPQRLQALAGITYRQLNCWIERGLLQPRETRGNTRVFGEYDAFLTYVLGAFRQRGASMEVLEKIARFLSTNPEPAPNT
jgi:hypothetical protein